MKTAKTENEFNERLKEGQPFRIEGTAQIHIVLLDSKKPPVMQIIGSSDNVFRMLSFAMSKIADDALKQGIEIEEVTRILHTLADAAMYATMEDINRKEI